MKDVCALCMHSLCPAEKKTVKVIMKKTRRLWSETKPTVNTFVGPW